jgi:hypothetical protein
MSFVKIKDNHLRYNGVDYFRANSENVRFGSIGEKRTPLTKANYLEVKDQISPSKFKVARSTVALIDTGELSRSDIKAQVTALIPVGGVPVPTKLDAQATFEKFKSLEVKLVKFVVLNAHMVDALNDSPDKRDKLAGWGNNARVAIEYFVAMHTTVAEKFNHNAEVTLSAGVDQVVQATVGGGGSGAGTTTVKISKPTCFAYLLAKARWKGNRVQDLEDDQWSLD